MLLRSDWLILSVKDWCCINCSVSVSLLSPLPEPSGYFISDRQHKQKTSVTQVPDAAEQTSIHLCFLQTHIYIYIYTLSGLDVAQQHWSGAGTGGDSGLTNASP